MISRIGLFTVFVLLVQPVHAQPAADVTPAEPAAVDTTTDTAGTAAADGAAVNWQYSDLIAMVAVLVFGAILILVMAILILKTRLRWTPYAVVRLMGLTLVIITSIIVMLMPDRDATKSVMGLLGAVAGYLLGKDSSNRETLPGKTNEAAVTPAKNTDTGE